MCKGTDKWHVDLALLKKTIDRSLQPVEAGVIAFMHVLVSKTVNSRIERDIVNNFYSCYERLLGLNMKISSK